MVETWLATFFSIMGVVVGIIGIVGLAVYGGHKLFHYLERRFNNEPIVALSVILYVIMWGVAFLTTLITVFPV